MNKVITHVQDTQAFLTELEALAPSYVYVDEQTNEKRWTIQHTPIVKNENGTLALSMLTDDELLFIEQMTTIKSLGIYEELFADEASLALYKSVYPFDVPIEYVDEDNVTQSYLRPQKIGEFA